MTALMRKHCKDDEGQLGFPEELHVPGSVLSALHT